jgi:hypothetical protein
MEVVEVEVVVEEVEEAAATGADTEVATPAMAVRVGEVVEVVEAIVGRLIDALFSSMFFPNMTLLHAACNGNRIQGIHQTRRSLIGVCTTRFDLLI